MKIIDCFFNFLEQHDESPIRMCQQKADGYRPCFADSFESENMTAWSSSETDAGDLDVVALAHPSCT